MTDCTNLKEGDEVIMWTGDGWSPTAEIAKVEKVYKLHLLVGGYKFRRASGYRAGGDPWNHMNIEPVTQKALKTLEEIKAERKRNILANKIRAEVVWRSQSMETLQSVAAIIWPTEEDHK